MRASVLYVVGSLAFAWLSAGCGNKAAAPPISHRACPAELGANACARYQYYMGATDEVFAGLPESEARRDAIKAFTPSQCEEAGKRLRAWMATATAQRAQLDASGTLPEGEQVVLRYGASKNNFDIDLRDGALREVLDRCSGTAVVTAIGDAGLFPVTSGVLHLTTYRSPN